jgi:hypothetical protein
MVRMRFTNGGLCRDGNYIRGNECVLCRALKNRQQQKRNTGVLHYVQDDGVERTTTSAEADPSLRSRMTMFLCER